MAGIGSFEPFGGYFKDLVRGVFGRGEPGSRRFPRSPQLGPNPGLSGYYPSMGGSADKSYRGASFPSEEKDIAWALALNIASQEGRDISDREVQREIFYETFPNAPLDGFKNFMMKVTDPEFEYNPENKDPARFRILDAAGNVIRDFGRGGKNTMVDEYGCPPGYTYNSAIGACMPNYFDNPPDPESEIEGKYPGLVGMMRDIRDGILDPNTLSEELVNALIPGDQPLAEKIAILMRFFGANKEDRPPPPSEEPGDDEDNDDTSSPPTGPGPSPGNGSPPGQEEPGRGGAGEPPLANGECIPPFVPITLPPELGGGTYCGLLPNLPDSGDDKKEEKPKDTGGDETPSEEGVPPNQDGTCPINTKPVTIRGETRCIPDIPDNDGGDKDKEGTPKPDANGVCPPGYIGRDTNGDGINDICIPIGMGILDLLRMGVGMAGSGPSGRSQTELDKAAEQAGLQIFNDPVNFMRYSPSALQMQDPRYYGITSFVPKGEEPDFNLGYRGVPGQMYANYNVDDKTGALSPRNARNGGIISLAEGGETNFPRKNGQIAGPGTERSDDIPAMLSDGEFVVNAKAVRGIGRLFNGKIKDKKNARREGARAMYALQRAGEKAAGLS